MPVTLRADEPLAPSSLLDAAVTAWAAVVASVPPGGARTLASYDKQIRRTGRCAWGSGWLWWCESRCIDPLSARLADLRTFVEHCPVGRETLPPRPATMAQHRSALKRLYALWQAEGYVTGNPATGLPAYRCDAGVSPARFLSLDYRAAMVDHARAHVTVWPCGRRAYAVMRLLHDLGLRAGDICRLDVGDFEPDEAGIAVLRFTGKGGRTHIRQLSGATADALSAYVAHRERAERRSIRRGPLFVARSCGRTVRLRPSSIDNLVRRCARAVLDDPRRVSSHSFRHAFIVDCLDAGASLYETQLEIGHASAATTARYDLARKARAGRAAVKLRAWRASKAKGDTT